MCGWEVQKASEIATSPGYMLNMVWCTHSLMSHMILHMNPLQAIKMIINLEQISLILSIPCGKMIISLVPKLSRAWARGYNAPRWRNSACSLCLLVKSEKVHYKEYVLWVELVNEGCTLWYGSHLWSPQNDRWWRKVQWSEQSVVNRSPSHTLYASTNLELCTIEFQPLRPISIIL